jgi:hypothetical protein
MPAIDPSGSSRSRPESAGSGRDVHGDPDEAAARTGTRRRPGRRRRICRAADPSATIGGPTAGVEGARADARANESTAKARSAGRDPVTTKGPDPAARGETP